MKYITWESSALTGAKIWCFVSWGLEDVWSMRRLGFRLVELEGWVCKGAKLCVLNPPDDDVVADVGDIRILGECVGESNDGVIFGGTRYDDDDDWEDIPDRFRCRAKPVVDVSEPRCPMSANGEVPPIGEWKGLWLCCGTPSCVDCCCVGWKLEKNVMPVSVPWDPPEPIEELPSDGVVWSSLRAWKRARAATKWA